MTKSCKCLDEIPYPGHATLKSWYGYSREYLKHPERNRPEVVAWLIEQYSNQGDVVWDPMAGAGTVIREGNQLNRQSFGWDIDPWCRSLWADWVVPRWINDTVHLIVTSPDYFQVNHHPGKGARQEGYSKQINSTAGSAVNDVPGRLSSFRKWPEYAQVLTNIYQKCHTYLVDGGHIAVIVRNKIKEGAETTFVQSNARMLDTAGFTVVGAHPRRLTPSARYRQREKLKPGSPWVSIEWAVIGQKGGSV